MTLAALQLGWRRDPPPVSGPHPSCAAARAVGAAPILRGEVGYGPHLDRDRDGIASEPYGIDLRWLLALTRLLGQQLAATGGRT